MSEKNEAIVAEIKALVDQLSDLHAISVIESYMHNRRHHVGGNGEREICERILAIEDQSEREAAIKSHAYFFEKYYPDAMK